MHPWSHLPPDLRTPWGPARRRLHWQGDLGPGTSPDEVASYLHDLQALLDCGQRWGQVFAETGAIRAFYLELRETGDVGLDDQELAFWSDVSRQFEAQKFSRDEDEAREQTLADSALFEAAIATLVSSSTRTLLGDPLVIRSLTYSNPIRIEMEGSGFCFRGADVLAGTIVSWRQRIEKRRQRENPERAARLRMFEAQARFMEEAAEQVRAEARIKMVQADLAEMYALGVKSGAYPIVPPGALTQLVSASDLEAIARLNTSNFSVTAD